MKKFLFSAAVVATLTSCSLFETTDKNKLQPKLASAPRTPVNQMNPQMDMQQPMMLDAQAGQMHPNQMQPMNPNGMMMDAQAPQQPQPEVFVNQNVSMGMTPGAMPYDANIQDVGQPAPQPMAREMAPQPMMQQPAPHMQAMAPAPQAPVQDPNAVTVATNKKLPASLRPDYNNPLNSEAVPVAMPMASNIPMQPMMGQPMMMGQAPAMQMQQPMMMQQPMPAAGGMPMMGMGQPMLQPVNAPTMPVDQMQMSTQPLPVR